MGGEVTVVGGVGGGVRGREKLVVNEAGELSGRSLGAWIPSDAALRRPAVETQGVVLEDELRI